MNQTAFDVSSATEFTDIGYDNAEAQLVAQIASSKGLPPEPFARDLMVGSIHETAHQLMAVWQGCNSPKVRLSLAWPGLVAGRMISGSVVFVDVPDWQSSRRTIVVAGVVAEWLLQRDEASFCQDEWDLFDSLRDGAWMSDDERELTDGKITWHAVKRASKLLQRHWSIVAASSASKRKDLLSRLGSHLCMSYQQDSIAECNGHRSLRGWGSYQSASLDLSAGSSRVRPDRSSSAMARLRKGATH